MADTIGKQSIIYLSSYVNKNYVSAEFSYCKVSLLVKVKAETFCSFLCRYTFIQNISMSWSPFPFFYT